MINITLTDLRYVVALAQEKHFGRAAEKCFISQPTLSVAIKKLESYLGVIIFERDKNHVFITQGGLQIIEQAREILILTENLQNFAKNIRSFANPLRVGAINTVGPYLFPNLIQEIHKIKCELKLIIEEGFTIDITQKLINNELDVIIVAEPFNHPSLTNIHLYFDPLFAIVSNNHHWCNKDIINLNELTTQTLLLLGSGHCFRNEVLQVCPQCFTQPETNEDNKMITTTSLETIKCMVANNIGISVIPQSSITNIDHQNIKVIPFIPPIPKRNILLAYRKNNLSRKIAIDELAGIIIKLMSNIIK